MSDGKSNLTPPQSRVLRYCREQIGWISLLELQTALEEDDVVVVPSLIGLGLLEHRVALGTVKAAACPSLDAHL